MKRFLINIILYSIIVLLIVVCVESYRIWSGNYEKNIVGSEVYSAISKSKTKRKVKKVLLGDSVGCQLYPCQNDYDSIVSLACNQAITMAGQYFLLKSYIENNEDLPEEVILLITPFSLKNDVDNYAYQYFLKPFPFYKYSRFYTEHLKQRIQTIPFYWSANLPIFQTSGYTPQYAVPLPVSHKSISPLTHEYLLKLDSICENNRISFRMVSTPVRDDKRADLDSIWANLPMNYSIHFMELLKTYKESVIFLPSKEYVDEVHFIKERIPQDYLKLLN